MVSHHNAAPSQTPKIANGSLNHQRCGIARAAFQEAGPNFLRSALGTSADRLAIAVQLSSDVASATAGGSWTISPLGDRTTVFRPD